MPKYTMVAWSNPSDDDRAFGEWYNQEHLPDMLGISGFTSAQRFKLLRLAHSKMFNQRYLCIYEFDANDDEHAKQVIDRLNQSDLKLNEVLDVSSVNLGIYKAEGPFFFKKDDEIHELSPAAE